MRNFSLKENPVHLRAVIAGGAGEEILSSRLADHYSGRWRAFFDGMSDLVLGKRVEIEAASLDLGDQIVAEWVPLLGITYNSHDDLLDVALGGLNHLIRHPREI